jgi:divalent metal cation (Fe/Co/Zn/Cd) transporter
MDGGGRITPAMTTNRSHLVRFAWLSIAAAIATISIKAGAWWLTGSVGLLSDALESIVNLVAAAMTLWMLTLSARPPTEEYPRLLKASTRAASKALIFAAALAIAWAAVDRLLHPQPRQSDSGLRSGVALRSTGCGARSDERRDISVDRA